MPVEYRHIVGWAGIFPVKSGRIPPAPDITPGWHLKQGRIPVGGKGFLSPASICPELGVFVHGASDAHGMYPAEHPVRPDDLAATMHQLLGIDPATEVYDRADRPLMISQGKPVEQ